MGKSYRNESEKGRIQHQENKRGNGMHYTVIHYTIMIVMQASIHEEKP